MEVVEQRTIEFFSNQDAGGSAFSKKPQSYCESRSLKGHANEVDFLGFLQKLVPHRSLILHFELFGFWLQIRGDIRNRKTTPRLGESGSRLLNV